MFKSILLSLASVFPWKISVHLYKAGGVHLGKNVRMHRGFYVNRGKDLWVGDNSFINYGVHCHLGGAKLPSGLVTMFL